MRRTAACVVAWVLLLSTFSAVAAGRASGGRQTLVHQGIERSYVVRLPAAPTPPDQRLPLVLVLHGGGGHAANAEAMTGFTDKANREGFIVVYPEGTGRFKGRLLTWNAGHCCGHAMERRVNDVDFIRTLIERLVADYPVDPRRVYATGMSNGGMMTHRLGIELSDRLAAIAPVVSTLFGDEKTPPHAVAALMINGQLDAAVPPEGGAPGGRFTQAWDGTPAQPAAAQGSFWAAANGCTNPPETIEQGRVLRSRYRCMPGHEVELVLVRDSGHAWPGGQPGSRRGDTPSTALNATDLIWSFFKTHSK
ncbi:alpha/beta hydrolase family esterase [Piscinibacter sp.]|jgi:polyhydroxybutyrate depolymerase|uniref:extracellular catalytic domain type 1 short-chain-length polyhydroxyalkanoate depolymerase n=1 Tax=Piscinibacter sp. TaxID=1903157 RepID=UPI00355AC138